MRVAVNVGTRLHSRNICYLSYHRPLSSRLLSKSWRIKHSECSLLCVYVKHGPSCKGKKICRGGSRTGWWGRDVPKKDEVPGDWRKLNNENARSLYSTPNNIRVIKFRRLKSVGHVARTGRRYMHTNYWRSNLKERNRPIGRSITSSKITKCVLNRLGEHTQDLSGSG
jgi:hypothetical protein